MKLSTREQYSIYGAAIFICLFIAIKFMFFPFVEKKERIARMIEVKTIIVEKMKEKKAEYDSIKNKASLTNSRFVKRPKGFTLFSFLDKLAGSTGIKDNIIYMKPSTTRISDSKYKISLVEMKLGSITLKQLTGYLYKVERSGNLVYVKRLSISKKGNKEGLISAVLQVETYLI